MIIFCCSSTDAVTIPQEVVVAKKHGNSDKLSYSSLTIPKNSEISVADTIITSTAVSKLDTVSIDSDLSRDLSRDNLDYRSSSCQLHSESNEVGDCAKTKTQREKGPVTFGTVHTYFHEKILGDNPSVVNGLPLTITWESFKNTCESVEDFERSRKRKKARQGPFLKISAIKRKEYLVKKGYKLAELQRARQEIVAIQGEIKKTEEAFGPPTTVEKHAARTPAYPAPWWLKKLQKKKKKTKVVSTKKESKTPATTVSRTISQ